MIRRNGAQKWENIHVTFDTQLDDLIDIDNSPVSGPQPVGFKLLKQTANDVDALIQEARTQGKRIRALGSGWALSDIAITDGWLLNTKLLNGCFDVSTKYFEGSYPEVDRPYLVIAQCGMSVGELNVHLEVTATSGFRRALKTAGIGAGQTIGGAVSGNTHGSAINFGAMNDFVVGLQLVTGSGKSLWIERASRPVLNDEFLQKLDADLIRDDDVFNAAVVSFGAFGVITAVAVETLPAYHLKFRPVEDISHADLKAKLNNFDFNDPAGLYHYEFIFDPYSKSKMAMAAYATKEPYTGEVPTPKPVWITRNEKGFSPGDQAPSFLLNFPFISPALKTSIQFKQYRKLAILDDVIGTPGQLYTATVFYGEGYTETAMGVSIDDAAKMIEISSDVIKAMKLPAISQVRVVHPTQALFGFTQHGPKTCVFEFGLLKDAKYPVFEEKITKALSDAGIAYTFHWSKNSGLTLDMLEKMYGAAKIDAWKVARKQVFNNDSDLMKVFDNHHIIQAGLA